MASTTTTEERGVKALWRVLPGSAKAGLFLGILAFFVPVTVEQERFVSGVPTCEFFDFGAWILGIVTVVTGLVTLVESRRSSRRLLVLGLGLGIVALGVFHVMRAYGVFFSPC